jgi:hypothetical protein
MEDRIPYIVEKTTRTRISELREETDKEWSYGQRKEYLKALMVPIVYRCLYLYAKYEIVVGEGNLVAMDLLGGRLKEEIKKLVKIENELYFTKPTTKKKGNEITDDMIERARQYPYGDLIELKRNMAVCPFHEDRSPSFSVKNNHGKCFSCQWHGDPISFYMEKQGVGFQEAVRALQ